MQITFVSFDYVKQIFYLKPSFFLMVYFFHEFVFLEYMKPPAYRYTLSCMVNDEYK